MTPADGDDYTYDNVQAGAVLNPGAQPGTAGAWAELREQFGGYFDQIEDVDAWVSEQRRREDAPPDLRTLAERERDDVAALHRRMEALEAIVRAKVQVGQIDAGRLDALERDLNLLVRRVDGSVRLAQLERTVAALAKVLEVRLP